MVQYDLILFDFFENKFGRTLGTKLIDMYLGKVGIHSREELRKLPVKKQQRFVRYCLESIFSQFYSTEQIFRINLLCLFRFALGNAAEKTQDMTSMDTLFSQFDFSNISSITFLHNYFEKKEEGQLKDDIFSIFKFSGDLEAFLIIRHKPDVAKGLSTVIVQKMMGMDEVDESMVEGALSEFYNIIVPSFSDVISNAFSTEFTFIPADRAEVEKHIKEMKDDDIMSLNSASTEVNLEGTVHKIECVVIMTKMSDTLKSLIHENVTSVDKDLESSAMLVEKTDILDFDLSKLFKVIFREEYKTVSLDQIKEESNISLSGKEGFLGFTRLVDYIYKAGYVDPKRFSKEIVSKNIKYLSDYE